MSGTSRFPPGVAAAMLVLVVGVFATSTAAKAQGPSTLTVTVQFVALGGAAPAPGRADVSPRPSPTVGVAVWVVPAGGPVTPPQAMATTDAAGVASFTLPPGSYWVIVPRFTSPPPGMPGGAIVRELPDGTLVQGWTPVELAPASSADVSILLTVPLP
jgi:hypothetical protein